MTVFIIIVKLQCVQSTKRPVLLLSPVKRLDKDKSFLCTKVGQTGQRKLVQLISELRGHFLPALRDRAKSTGKSKILKAN